MCGRAARPSVGAPRKSDARLAIVLPYAGARRRSCAPGDARPTNISGESNPTMTMKLTVLNEADTDAPWFADGLSFTCTACGNCCTGGPGFVWITKEEIGL